MANEKIELNLEFLESKGFVLVSDPIEQQIVLFEKVIIPRKSVLDKQEISLVLHRVDGDIALAIVQDGVVISLTIKSKEDFDRAEEFAKMIKNIEQLP